MAETLRADSLVLCYHAVSSDWPDDVAVHPARLTQHLEALVRRGYRGVTFTEAVTHQGPGKVVAVTFDDGYLSVARIARPILGRLGMPGTVFVATGFIGGGSITWPRVGRWLATEHRQELQTMTWGDVRQLRQAGWEVGSHTRSHPRLTTLSDQDLLDELTGSRHTCEEALEAPCRSIAFPYGDHDERVIAATQRAGYATAATVSSGLRSDSPLRWPRVYVSRFDETRLLGLKTASIVRRSRVLTRLTRMIGERGGERRSLRSPRD